MCEGTLPQKYIDAFNTLFAAMGGEDAPEAQQDAMHAIYDLVEDLHGLAESRARANRSFTDWMGALCRKLDKWHVPKETECGEHLDLNQRIAHLVNERDEYKAEVARLTVYRMSPVMVEPKFKIWVNKINEAVTEYVIACNGTIVAHRRAYSHIGMQQPSWTAYLYGKKVRDTEFEADKWRKLEGEEFEQALAAWYP